MNKAGKWTLIALTPVLAAGMLAVSSSADEWGRGQGFRQYGRRAHFARHARREGFRGEYRLARMKEALGLTDEQVIKIRDIFTEARKAGIKNGADLRVARIEMRELMRADKVDRAAVNAKIKQISALREKMMTEGVDTRLKVRGVLTPEQIKKAQALTFSRRGFGPRGTSGPGMGGGPRQGKGPRNF